MFYPQDAPVPETLQTDDLLLRPLRATDAELDYDAVMESRASLRRWGGGIWPTEEFTLAENLADLVMHEQEHLNREAFTYTVMNPSATECLGCLYITPLNNLLKQATNITDAERANVGDYEVVARFWIRDSRLPDKLDERLLDALRQWFSREWAFSRLLFRTNENDVRQQQLFTDKGFHLQLSLQIPGRTGRYLHYG